MRISVIVIAMLWITAESVNAESFYLREAGKAELHGPYEYKDGGIVDLGTNRFVVVREAGAARQERRSAEDKLKEIVIPEIDFRSARVADVFEFLVQSSLEFDKDVDEDRRGVNIILNLHPEEQDRTVTFQAKDLSLMDILKLVSRIAGLSYRISGGIVVIGSSGKFETEIVMRSYTIPLTLVKEIRETGAKEYFEEMGVKFPDGASARYNSATGKLIVMNTLRNVRILEQILSGLGVPGLSSQSR